jgi:beta-galactosidase
MPAIRTALFLLSSLACAQTVPPVWDLEKSWRESTPTRERLSVNGLWQWQPAAGADEAPPAGAWGTLRVPEPWPSGGRRPAPPSALFHAHPEWASRSLSGVTAAWYQRRITVPRGWAGRRITLTAAQLNSYAAVWVDGKRLGEMRYPFGEVDLTGACAAGRTCLLSLRVEALPLKAVMLAFNDTASARQVQGTVARRGLCGDVWLAGTPAGARTGEVRVETSVRRWEVTVNARLEGLDAAGRYRLRARILDGAATVKEFTSDAFRAGELNGGRFHLTTHWRPDKLWDLHTPGNQYTASVSLLSAGGAVADTALPLRFGFREFWIDGRDFYLNGSRIYLSSIPLDNAQGTSIGASFEATRATLQRYKSFGINFVYTHNYGCEPGTHLSFEEVLRAADDEGVLLSFSQPHFGHYDWDAPDADRSNGYAGHAAYYASVAGSHPSVVCYSTSHNGAGYSEDMNPDGMDGIQSPRDRWSLRGAGRALRAEALIRRADPSRFVYHHSAGNLGVMNTVNFYGNWIPAQEMSDWFERWATAGVKPLFTCEYSVPFMWDWAMYRGWYKGKREFGSAEVPWEFAVAEWNAQFLGDTAYRIGEEEKANLRWEAAQFRKGRGWKRWDYPQSLNSTVFDDRYRVVAKYLEDNWRAFRTWGLSANSPWDYGSYWKKVGAVAKGEDDPGLPVDADRLQRPGPRPVYLREDEAKARLAYRASDWVPTAAAEALYRNNMPLLAYIAGKAAAFTSKDHVFAPGETVEKQVIVVNNSRVAVAGKASWSVTLPGVAAGEAKVALPTGEQQRIAVRFAVPANAAAGSYEIRATARFDNGQEQTDRFALHVLRPASLAGAATVAVYDPSGDTARLLRRLGVRIETVKADAPLDRFQILAIGRGALTPTGPAPDLARVRDGLKVVVFEQTAQALEKRLGFRVAEYGLRQVFRRIPDHPLLAGLSDEHLRDWRGEATTLGKRLEAQPSAQFNNAPAVEWAGIPVTRVWRAGNRGSVASILIEKPGRGDFLAVVDGGFSLQFSPLVEYREGSGMVLFCQMDVTGRSEEDPAAAALVRNLFAYVTGWKPAERRTVLYAGEAAGESYLQSAGYAVGAWRGGAPEAAQILVVGPGGAARAAEWVRAGGRAVALGLAESEAALLAGGMTVKTGEHVAWWFPPFGSGSPFAGIAPADVHNRDPRNVALIDGGVLASTRDGRVVFAQVAPWQLDYAGGKMNVKRTYRRWAALTARLLGNQGAAPATGLLRNVSSPVGAEERRWLESHYLDAPEEWDDPYRFFRW